MDIKIEKENAFSIIVKTKQFNEETSFDEVPKYWVGYYEQGFQNVVPPMLGICINNPGNLDFECYSEGDSDSDDYVSGIWVALKLK